MKKGLRFCIFGCAAVVGGMIGNLVYLYHHREFGPPDFRHAFVLKLEGQTSDEMKNEAAQILNQKFIYLGSGTQVTAFESEDHRYVIKFFNPRNTIKENWFHKTSRLRQMSSLNWIIKAYFQKKARLLKFFKCHRLAFQDLREESGLIYLHFDRSSSLSQKLNIIDKEGKAHLVDLNVCPFVLQKKVEIARQFLDQKLQKGDIQGAREGVRQIYRLFLSRAQKGYTDHRQNISKNYGFIEGHAVQLDVGRIRKDVKVKQMPLKEVERVISYISPLLPPELVPVLQDYHEKQASLICHK